MSLSGIKKLESLVRTFPPYSLSPIRTGVTKTPRRVPCMFVGKHDAAAGLCCIGAEQSQRATSLHKEHRCYVQGFYNPGNALLIICQILLAALLSIHISVKIGGQPTQNLEQVSLLKLPRREGGRRKNFGKSTLFSPHHQIFPQQLFPAQEGFTKVKKNPQRK